jgi:glycosyltransferase involved in cell wall biosynthesis
MGSAGSAAAAEDFTVIAILAAFNEGDVVAQVIADLVRQGIQVYMLDHGSTDDTVAQAEPFLGNGLLEIERLPAGPTVRWSDVLRRKEELASRLAADWFLHQDADEFRESPWENLGLREAVRRVDRLGYDAIDFELLNFWPTHDGFRPGADVREAFQYYEHAQSFDKVQVRCWRRSEHAVDLVSSGGHDAIFPGRKVFPLRFLLRHYPVRGQAHGERKVLEERLARFAPEERAQGWHVQYAAALAGKGFLRDSASLILYDPERVRLRLLLQNRRVEELEELLAARDGGDRPPDTPETAGAHGSAPAAGSAPYERLSRELHARNLELAAERERAEGLSRELDERHREAARLAGELGARDAELLAERERAESFSRALDERHREAALLAGELHARNLELAAERERAESLSRALDERHREAALLAAELDGRNREAALLAAELDGRNREAALLAAELGARDAELAAERERAESSSRALDERNREAALLAGELAARAAELDARRRDLAAILASRSWRWTAPLRAAGRRSRRR